MERNNARYPSAGKTPELIGLIFCDASFTDFKTVLHVGLEMATSGIYLIAVIKTQFGVSKGMFEKGGEVSSPGLHCKVSEKIKGWLETQPGCFFEIAESPIKGPEGNLESLIG